MSEDLRSPPTYMAENNASINSSGAHSPPATAGHLVTLSVPGMGHKRILSRPGGWALAYPGATPGFLTHACFRKMDEFIGQDAAFVKDWLVRQGIEKLVDVFKGMFSQF